MRTVSLIASGIFFAALAVGATSVPAQAKTMKECAAEWDKMKAANQTGGMKYRDFTKKCMSGEAAAPEATNPPSPPPPPEAAPPAPATAEPAKKPPSPGRLAMIKRERACAAEWKADKAAGKIPAGMHWPQYWSQCNKRKKAEGM